MCAEDGQTNFVRLEQPQAPGEAPRYIPWMQVPAEREFFIDNSLVRIHFIIVMIGWTGLAP